MLDGKALTQAAGKSAGAVTIYKCTTFKGLIDLQDFTYALSTLVLWTK